MPYLTAILVSKLFTCIVHQVHAYRTIGSVMAADSLTVDACQFASELMIALLEIRHPPCDIPAIL